jgi:hypothetical protein
MLVSVIKVNLLQLNHARRTGTKSLLAPFCSRRVTATTKASGWALRSSKPKFGAILSLSTRPTQSCCATDREILGTRKIRSTSPSSRDCYYRPGSRRIQPTVSKSTLCAFKSGTSSSTRYVGNFSGSSVINECARTFSVLKMNLFHLLPAEMAVGIMLKMVMVSTHLCRSCGGDRFHRGKVVARYVAKVDRLAEAALSRQRCRRMHGHLLRFYEGKPCSTRPRTLQGTRHPTDGNATTSCINRAGVWHSGAYLLLCGPFYQITSIFFSLFGFCNL